MRIGILGTGMVGATIGARLVQRGHEVRMGSRSVNNPRAADWSRQAGGGASHGTYRDTARFGEVLFNCTAGVGSLDALRHAGREALDGKVLIDVANPLGFSGGMPPTLAVCNTDSLGERIQRAFPGVRVVKALNTMNCSVMVNPALVPGTHNVFLSGDDAAAKGQVATWLAEWFGWEAASIVDLGDITTARGTEMLLPLWIRLWRVLGTANFNFRVAVAPAPDAPAAHAPVVAEPVAPQA